jgi:hypothetical protein
MDKIIEFYRQTNHFISKNDENRNKSIADDKVLTLLNLNELNEEFNRTVLNIIKRSEDKINMCQKIKQTNDDKLGDFVIKWLKIEKLVYVSLLKTNNNALFPKLLISFS